MLNHNKIGGYRYDYFSEVSRSWTLIVHISGQNAFPERANPQSIVKFITTDDEMLHRDVMFVALSSLSHGKHAAHGCYDGS